MAVPGYRCPHTFCDFAIRATSAILTLTNSCWNRGDAMGAKRSWWHRVRKLLETVGIIVVCALGIVLIVGIIGGYLFHWSWTGVTNKTLWDWLQLLIIPAVLALADICLVIQPPAMSED